MPLEHLGIAVAGVFFGGCGVVLVVQWLRRRRARRGALMRGVDTTLDVADGVELAIDVARSVGRMLD